VLSNRGGVAGQALVLSKALGTGVVGQAIKKGEATPEELAAAVASMTLLNAEALAAGRRHGVTACTDVTGFGLLGHLRNILRGSGVGAEIQVAAVPLLPGALDHARAGRIPGGSKANLAFLDPTLEISGTEDPALTLLLADAQTSGGLLHCVPAAAAADLVADLRQSGHPAAHIGQLAAGTGTRLIY
jgi:selenide,water dikinase